jgi:hypothetical protein
MNDFLVSNELNTEWRALYKEGLTDLYTTSTAYY